MADYGRVTLDQWYTPDEWAEACVMDYLIELPEDSGRLFVEPSAGRGAFVWPLEDLGEQVDAFDLDPKHRKIQINDFLLDDTPECEGAVVIGNPPYGTRHSLSKAFVVRAFEQGAHRVAFLLPLGFLRTAILSIGKRVEYFKIIRDIGFVGPHGSKLPMPAQMMAWIVLSNEPIQPADPIFERCDIWDADSFWLQGVEYGLECDPVPYLKVKAQGIFTGTRAGDGKRLSGKAYRRLKPTPEDTSLLLLVAAYSGNGIQPTAESANWLLSNGEIFRGEITL